MFPRKSSATTATLVAATLLATIVLTGCRSATVAPPGALPIERDMRNPQIRSIPIPAMPGSGRYPAMPGSHLNQSMPPLVPQASVTPTAGARGSVGDWLGDPSPEIAQVGFIEKLRGGALVGGGGCPSCNGSVACGGCATGDCSAAPFGYCAPPLGGEYRFGSDPQEFLCDGGDEPGFARVRRDGSLGGLDPQDTVVHYTTEAGDVKVQPSTRACVYAPKFGAVRQVTGAVAGEKAVSVGGMGHRVGPTGINLDLPSLTMRESEELGHADVAKRVDAFRERNRGVPVEGIVHLERAEDVLQAMATIDWTALDQLNKDQLAVLKQSSLAAQTWMIRDAVEVMIESLQPPVLIRDARAEAFVEYDFPDAGRLRIVKMADSSHAQQGDEVSFVIRVDNVGDSQVNEVVIADNLVARLEYVDGSEKSDREAEFGTSRNDVGSLILKWTLTEPLDVGEGAVIEFKCKIR